MGKILVIEDDLDNMEAIKLSLNSDGFEVVGISGTDNIIRDVQQHNPDLILTDYLLKGLNGGSICQILSLNTATKHIPVVLITAHRDIAMTVDKSCFNDIVIKPFDIKELLKSVNEGLKHPRVRMQ